MEEVLLYLEETDEEAGAWWMEKNEDVWTEWVPEDVAKKVKAAIN